MQQAQGDSQKNTNPVELFNPNSSYCENYHEKYYYPKLVHDRVVQRKAGDINKFDSKSKKSRSTHPAIKGAEEETTGSDPLPSPTPMCNACGWFLDPSELIRGSGSGLPVEVPHTCNTGKTDNSVSRGVHPHVKKTDKDIECRKRSTMDNANDWPEELSKGCVGGKSSESVTSEDSVFSEDYTAMTDGPETREVKLCDIEQESRRVPVDGSEEADSSFSSPFSSTGTLEADGKENGGTVKDVWKDKVVANDAGNIPPVPRKDRPDVRLLLGDPSVEFEAGSPPPSPELEKEGDTGGSEKPGGEGANMKSSDSASFYEDREFDFLKTEPVRRSTSLKTYKTPPGTPSRKKAVRFADALGLDLESVRHILNLEEPPEVPKSAMKDLRVGIEEDHKTDGVKYLSALFSQPGVDPGFVNRISEGKVVLENLIVDDKDMTLSGTIKVANISYHKHVIVRYSTNGWVSSDDITASYVQNSNDGTTDRFSFTLNVPKYFAVGQRMEFALMYNAGGHNYWDNNYGKNYAVECYARAMPVSESDNTWMHFL